MFLPKNEGIDHINVYTKSNQELGRLLTNLSDIPFTHPKYGYFKSVESFWYWYLTGCVHDELKQMGGFQAKKYGQTLRDARVDKEGLTDIQKEVILSAIRLKLKQNQNILKLLVHSDLPFTHYYYYGDIENPKVVHLPQYSWIIDELERIRKILKDKYVIKEI